MRLQPIITLILSLSLLSGCGVLIGNVKPVAEKSDEYAVMELPQTDQNWRRIDVGRDSSTDEKAEQSEIPDVAFQSKKTKSIISLNSTCRPHLENVRNLRPFSQEPLFGITEIGSREERELRVDQEPAYETTVEGKMDSEPTKVRSIVVKKRSCLYDVLLVSRPNHFAEDEAIFSRFVTSLRFPKR